MSTQPSPPIASSAYALMDSAKGYALAAMVLIGLLSAFFFYVFLDSGDTASAILSGLQASLIVAIYLAIYLPLSHGDARGSRSPAIVLGILSLILAMVLPGILLFIAYAKTGRAIAITPHAQASHPLRPSPGLYGGSAGYAEVDWGSQTGPTCSVCGSEVNAGDRYCSECGSRLMGP